MCGMAEQPPPYAHTTDEMSVAIGEDVEAANAESAADADADAVDSVAVMSDQPARAAVSGESSDDDFEASHHALKTERQVPIMHSKESWSGLPKLLKVGNNFECRVDAESIAMA